MSIEDGTYKEKDLFGIPWHVAFALQANGWDTAQRDHLGKALGDAREREGSALQLLRVCVPVSQVEPLLLRCDSDRRAEWQSRTESLPVQNDRQATIRDGIGIGGWQRDTLAGRQEKLRH